MYCSCGAKLIIECPRDKQGERYEYFTCSGRRKKNGCTRSAIMIDRIEREVEATFGQNGLSAEEAAQTRAVLGKVFDQLEASTEDERKLLTGQADKLEAERLKLVQAHYADAIPLDLMKTEQARITANLDSIKRRLVGLSSTYKEAREGLDQLADLITDLGDLYRKCEPSARQILVRAVVKKIVIDEDENISYEQTKAVSTAKTYAAQQNDAGSVTTNDSVIAETGVHLGEVSNFSHRVDAMEHYGNRRQRVERLESAWNQGSDRVAQPAGEPDDPLIEAAAEPRRRARTLLTDEEVDAMRTARANGVSVNELARQFGIHRGTVWAKTHDA